MRNYPFILLLFASVLFQSCSEHELAPSQGVGSEPFVSFSLDEKASAEIPDGSTLLIGVMTSSGEIVYADHPLALTRIGGLLTSENIALDADDFELTEFVVLDSNDEVIYASPKEGSAMAEMVLKPLAHKFTARGMSHLELPVEVAAAKNVHPGKFGYDSFKKKPKNTFQIIAYFYDDGVKTPTDSYLQIENEESEFYYYMRGTEISTFTFTGDPKETYTLTAYRPGFYRESMEFTMQKLKGKKKNLIEIIFEFTDPADVMTMTAIDDGTRFTLGLVGVGAIRTDFGNGSGEYGPFPANPEIVTPTDTSYMTFENEEDAWGSQITVSGDLDQVVSFENSTSVNSIDVTRLPNLSKFTYNNSFSEVLDLTQNSQLAYLALVNSGIRDIQLEGNTKLSKVYLENMFYGADDVVREVYENAVAHNITNGSIVLVNQTISESSRQILSDLQSKYNWSVTIEDNS